MTDTSPSRRANDQSKKTSPQTPPIIGQDRQIALQFMVNAEMEAIKRRRNLPNKGEEASAALKPELIQTGPGSPVLDVTALALSGGGIRSASFSLGVLQALSVHSDFRRIDYLSTVSGGGYIGSALTATMTKSKGAFVFGERAAQGASGRLDVADTAQLGHLRNYSNYLIPFGARDVITALAIITRGLVANGAIVLGVALYLAALTILGNPHRSELLDPNLLHFQFKGIPLLGWLHDMHFGVTMLLLLVGGPLFLVWALYRSTITPPPSISENSFGFWWCLLAGCFVALAATVCFGPFSETDILGSSAIFLLILMGELVFAHMIGVSSRVQKTVPRPWGWIILAGVHALNILLFLVMARNSRVLFEACVVLLPASLGLLLWAKLIGPARWESGLVGLDGEFRTWLPTAFAGYLVLVGFFAITEFQPFVIAGMFDLNDAAKASSSHSMLTEFIKWTATIATPVGAVAMFFREQIGTLFKSVTSSSAFTTKLLAMLVSAGTWIGGAAIPLLLWLGYLYLCFWGIANDGKPRDPTAPTPRPAIQGTIKIEGPGVDLSASIKCGPGERDDCAPRDATTPPEKAKEFAHAPGWLIEASKFAANTYYDVAPFVRPDWLDHQAAKLIAKYPLAPVAGPFNDQVPGLYAALAFVLLWLAWWLRPNANSLHQLYRDRLSKAFLFHPEPAADEKKNGVHSYIDPYFPPIGTMKLSELVSEGHYAPYHLINATLNVQGSDYANRRGRNSDFFLFSPLFVGSHATGYTFTQTMQMQTNLDLATAMTISGAAFSPNAGAASIAALTPTLALLNVRTGYWLANPGMMSGTFKPSGANLYLWNELTGRLREDRDEVFLSDGGHIENLGIYELLRRRCKIIVAVDAEADPAMRYPSFIALQRYARMDLGVRINMPWDEVRKTTRCWMGYTGDPAADEKDEAKSEPKPSKGPHVSIGTIAYDGNQQGWLVYIKASLTGDENDYVRDYARRYEAFPHESTGDQFFSEEQFEVYRALGFHIMARFLNAEDLAQVYDAQRGSVLGDINAIHPNIDPIRTALLKDRGAPPATPQSAPMSA